MPDFDLEFKRHIRMVDHDAAAVARRESKYVRGGRIVKMLLALLRLGESTQKIAHSGALTDRPHFLYGLTNKLQIALGDSMVESSNRDGQIAPMFARELSHVGTYKLRTGVLGMEPPGLLDQLRDEVDTDVFPFPAAATQKHEQIAKAAPNIENTPELIGTEALEGSVIADPLAILVPTESARIIPVLHPSLAVTSACFGDISLSHSCLIFRIVGLLRLPSPHCT